jgi:hypothetical protein
MRRKNHRAIVVRIIVAVAVLGVFAGPFADTAIASDNSVIKLGLDEVAGGRSMIRVNPRDAKIWRDNPEKSQQILWWMVKNRTSYSEIYWEFRFDASKEGGSKDFFGKVDLGCGEKEVIAEPEITPENSNAVWPYSITVYACRDGVKAQKLATANPKVIWQD